VLWYDYHCECDLEWVVCGYNPFNVVSSRVLVCDCCDSFNVWVFDLGRLLVVRMGNLNDLT